MKRALPGHQARRFEHIPSLPASGHAERARLLRPEAVGWLLLAHDAHAAAGGHAIATSHHHATVHSARTFDALHEPSARTGGGGGGCAVARRAVAIENLPAGAYVVAVCEVGEAVEDVRRGGRSGGGIDGQAIGREEALLGGLSA